MSEYDKYFQTRFKNSAARDNVWKVVVAYLTRYIPAGSCVLDLGGGYCSFINNIKAEEKHVIDTFDEVDQYAAQDVRVYKQSITKMDNLESSYYDIIFASNIFEHLTREELDGVILQIKRILKKGGRLIILQPNFRYAYKVYFDDYTHKQIFTAASLSDYLETYGFTIKVRKDRFIPFSMGARMPKFAMLIWLYLRSPIKPLAGQMLFVTQLEEGIDV